ncbi:hypothetical protein GW916_11995 [bacterium]|nr:hypothetical protein [bacterium]
MRLTIQYILSGLTFFLSLQVMGAELLEDIESALKTTGSSRVLLDFSEVEPLPVSQWPEELSKGVYAHLWQRNSGFDGGYPIGSPPINNPDLRPRYWGGIDGSYVIQDGLTLSYLVIYKVRLLDSVTNEEFYEYYLVDSEGELLKTGLF